jgi:hypothetical protein
MRFLPTHDSSLSPDSSRASNLSAVVPGPGCGLDVRFLNTLPVSIASRHSRARGNPGDVLLGLDASFRWHDVLLAPDLRNRHLACAAEGVTDLPNAPHQVWFWTYVTP